MVEIAMTSVVWVNDFDDEWDCDFCAKRTKSTRVAVLSQFAVIMPGVITYPPFALCINCQQELGIKDGDTEVAIGRVIVRHHMLLELMSNIQQARN